MDADIKYLLTRMDLLEHRLIHKIEELQSFKNKVVGMAIVCGGIGSMIVQIAVKYI